MKDRTESRRRYYLKHREEILSKNKLWAKRNPDKVKSIKRKCYLNNKETPKLYSIKWRTQNQEKWQLYQSQWRIDNKEHVKELSSNWDKRNKGKVRAKVRKRQAALIQRIPKWADLKAIEQFYKDCPDGLTVDHIVPLQGKNVSGLHVLNNLQYLTLSENSRKSNKYGSI